jgi:hypothetical protein
MQLCCRKRSWDLWLAGNPRDNFNSRPLLKVEKIDLDDDDDLEYYRIE